MTEAFESQKVGRFTVEVHYDDDPQSPREWDNGTVMLDFVGHGFGDKTARTAYDDSYAETLREFVAELLEGEEVVDWMPYQVTEGSQASVYELDKDSRVRIAAGVIYMTKRGQEEMGTPDDRVEEVLRGDLAVMDQYVSGDVYGYIVRDPNGEVVESCWGYFGKPRYAMSEGLAEAKWHVEQWEAKRDALMEGVEQEVEA